MENGDEQRKQECAATRGGDDPIRSNEGGRAPIGAAVNMTQREVRNGGGLDLPEYLGR